MGRPRRQWLLPEAEVHQRYESGEGLEALARACGLTSYSPIVRSLHEAGITIRSPGGRVPATPRPVNEETHVCKKDGCFTTFEVFPSSNKRYCRPQCRYSRPEMAVLLARNISGKHRLSEINPEMETALCAVCGPVKVRRRRQRRVHTTNPTWRCRTAERARVWARQYGLSLDDVLLMVRAQEGCCANCRREFADDFHVDHCHRTGNMRGLLCSNCNTALGLLGDDPGRLRAALRYLDRTVAWPWLQKPAT
jgi:hypothetical protein